MKHLRGLGVSLTVVSIALLLAASPASATTFDREHYSGTDAYSYDCDGVAVNVAVEFSGVAHIRVGKGNDDDAFFLHDNFEVREVHTASTGAVLILSANGLFQETKATRVDEPNVEFAFEFTSVLAGHPFTVTDADGNVLIRDRGVIRQTLIFNTEGDHEPGAIFIRDVDFQVAGPHPGLEFDTCDYFG